MTFQASYKALRHCGKCATNTTFDIDYIESENAFICECLTCHTFMTCPYWGPVYAN